MKHLVKAIATITFVILCFSQCKNNGNAKTAVPLPVMSKADGEKITEREISIWEFSKTKQFDKLRAILADDYIGYFSSGNMLPSDVINLLSKTTFTDYHLSNIKIKPVANDVAIIYYDVLQDVTGADGVKWIPKVSASSVYVKRNGVWYAVFYQEMPQG